MRERFLLRPRKTLTVGFLFPSYRLLWPRCLPRTFNDTGRADRTVQAVETVPVKMHDRIVQTRHGNHLKSNFTHHRSQREKSIMRSFTVAATAAVSLFSSPAFTQQRTKARARFWISRAFGDILTSPATSATRPRWKSSTPAASWECRHPNG